jgi:hypothetical protein
MIKYPSLICIFIKRGYIMKTWIIFCLVGILLVPTTIAYVSDTDQITEPEQSCGLAPLMTHRITPHDTKGIKQLETLGLPFYGYNAYDLLGEIDQGPCSFDPGAPEIITLLAPTTSGDFISGGTWANGQWYGCEFGGSDNTNIWTIDPETGDMISIGDYDPGNTGISLNGLAFDPISEKMYACSSTALYTVNMGTGALTLVGNFLTASNLMIAIDFDHNGNLYGIEIVTDALYAINKNTAVETYIGLTGYYHNYAQDMAYDDNEHIMYLSAYTELGGGLYTCNLGTGAATYIGNFQNDLELTALAIPSGANIEIGDISGGLGASIVLRNTGSQPATNVVWSASFSNAITLLPLGGVAQGTIDSLPAGEDQIVKARFLGFGGILRFSDVTITAKAENTALTEITLPGKLFLFIVII